MPVQHLSGPREWRAQQRQQDGGESPQTEEGTGTQPYVYRT